MVVILGAAALATGAWAADDRLLSGLDRMAEADAGRVLRERVEARAPVGGAEAGLADWLISEGFKVTTLSVPVKDAVKYSEAFKTMGSLVCRRQAMVKWRTAADGTITWLDARYGIGACL
ncbi:hypothetical protein ASD38_16895 [Caulobacter sp. Root487D2Y]|uniref:hypothetical protein n=1 Tax=Caulobacter sp. Root487D2Y TaxID=1736547 RepID=UPI0006FFE0DF|nr:hypothetical protein [Caulobacter sp. Root487D2Y]KQY27584.1 hypothetical protein ASD38_16895 [Caulobacter sp. Root487D2Y]